MAKHYRCMNMRCSSYNRAPARRHPVDKKTCICGCAVRYPRSNKGLTE